MGRAGRSGEVGHSPQPPARGSVGAAGAAVTYGHHQSQGHGNSGPVSWLTHLRRSLALSEAREALQVLSSGLLRAVGRVWSSTVRSLPCFHSS